MERVATDVAQPPIRGGELPSFEELLATGSFHARLARARAEREKALAEAGSADDFILDTSRKPWERDEGPRRRPDRLSVALEAAAAAEPARTTRPMLVPEIEADGSPRQIGAESVPARLPSLLPAVVPVPVGRPALPARRLHVLPVLRPVDADFEKLPHRSGGSR